jgi:hypothetical protein
VSPISRADQLLALQHVSKLLRQHVASPEGASDKKLFTAAADALDQRANTLTAPQSPSSRLVDIKV